MKRTSLEIMARMPVLVVLLFLAGPSRSQTVVNITYPGSVYSAALGINNNNVIVGAYTTSNNIGSFQGFVLSRGAFSTIVFPSAYQTIPLSINDAGSVVGFYYDATTNQDYGFLFSSGTYTQISFPGSTDTLAYGINNSGQIVGYYYTPDGKVHGFELNQGVYSTIDCSCGQTILQSINNTGTIVGYYLDTNNMQHGLEYNSGIFTTLDYPGATNTLLYGINDSGTVAGYWSNGSSIGYFLDSNGQYTAIAIPPPATSIGYLAINDSGQIVGEGDDFANSSFSEFGFLLSSGPFAYIGNAVSPTSTITVLDTSTDLVVTTIPGASYIGYPFATSPDQTHLYLPDGSAVDVVDTTTNTLVATIPGVGPNANGLTIGPDGLLGYTANYNGNVGSYSVFNTATNSVTATVPVAFAAGDVTVTPDGANLYISGTGSVIDVFNTSNNELESTFSISVPPVGYNGNGVFFPPTGSVGYVSQSAASVTPGTVTAISIPSNQTLATIPVGTQPGQIAFSPDGSLAYVGNTGSNNVSVINTASNSVIATVPVGNNPSTLAVTPDGSLVYVGNFVDSTLSIIQTSTNSVVATIPMAAPFGILIPAAPSTSQSLTQPLSPTALNSFNFGPHTFGVQYPAGTSFSNVNMTVTAAQTPSNTFRQRVGGTSFANATCITYTGTGGNCVDYQVTCSSTAGGSISCPSVATPSITVKTSFETQQQIINPGFLTTPIGTNDWTNIFTSFSLQQVDPTVKGRTKGFSEFVAVDLGAGNEQGAGVLQFLWPLRTTDPRIFTVGVPIPVVFQLTSIAHPGEPVTDAKAGISVVMISDASGNATSKNVLEQSSAFDRLGDYYFDFLDTRRYVPGTYVVTVYGDAFAAQQVQFSIVPPKRLN